MMGENIMTTKRLLGVLTVGLALMTLAACGQKSTESIIKNELKDSYTGYSENPGYDSLLFSDGGQEIIFDKSNHKLKSGDEEAYYEVVPEDELTKNMKGILNSHENDLAGKDYFIINVGYQKDSIWGKFGDQLYCVVLTDGGKKIRIFEFETGYTDDGYYDFSGTAD